MSNPTYFVTRGEWRAVLRKQPKNVLPSAHAIDREYRVLTALQGSSVPTPKPYRYCEDREIVGTPFYLMEWLDGRVFNEFGTPGLARGERTELFHSMCAALAAIHRLDYRALGLAISAGPETISPASSSVGRSNGRSSVAATMIIQRSTGWCVGLPTACRKRDHCALSW